MSDEYAVFVEGSFGDELGQLPAAIARNAARAINFAAARGRAEAAREIPRQVAFPSGYLNPGAGRLTVQRVASSTDLQAVIEARSRPTSLARFAVGPGTVGDQRGFNVVVKPGLARFIPRAFLVRLKSGTDTFNNQGLAVRTTNGKPPTGAYKPIELFKNVWLVYGPSVAQVFQGELDAARGVRDSIVPDVEQAMQDEFLRLMEAGL